jgi:hypothetical protein
MRWLTVTINFEHEHIVFDRLMAVRHPNLAAVLYQPCVTPETCCAAAITITVLPITHHASGKWAAAGTPQRQQRNADVATRAGSMRPARPELAAAAAAAATAPTGVHWHLYRRLHALGRSTKPAGAQLGPDLTCPIKRRQEVAVISTCGFDHPSLRQLPLTGSPGARL